MSRSVNFCTLPVGIAPGAIRNIQTDEECFVCFMGMFPMPIEA